MPRGRAAGTRRTAACSSGSPARGIDAVALLPQAVDAGVAFVPGAPFYAGAPEPNTLRLSFVTVTAGADRAGIAALAHVVREAIEGISA